jgi:hypothetical protein
MKNLEEVVEVQKTSKDVQHKQKARSNSTSSLLRLSGPVYIKIDA